MSKHPCGICKIGVKYQAICCTGPCNSWHHSRCLNWSDKQFKNLTAQDIASWICSKCKHVLKNTKTDIENLETKIHDLSQNDNLDHDTSLTLAAEVGNALLAENKLLKEKLYKEKAKQSGYHLELEDKVFAAEELIKDLEDKNSKLQTELNYLNNKLNSERAIRNELFEQSESEKTQFSKQINDLLSQISSLRAHINKLEEQAGIKAHSFDLLKREINILTNDAKKYEKELDLKNNLINEMAVNCEKLTEQIFKQAKAAQEHLKDLLNASKQAHRTVSSYTTDETPAIKTHVTTAAEMTMFMTTAVETIIPVTAEMTTATVANTLGTTTAGSVKAAAAAKIMTAVANTPESVTAETPVAAVTNDYSTALRSHKNSNDPIIILEPLPKFKNKNYKGISQSYCSASLLVKQSKEAKNVNKFALDQSTESRRFPPMSAVIRDPKESVQEFFNKNILHFTELRKKYQREHTHFLALICQKKSRHK